MIRVSNSQHHGIAVISQTGNWQLTTDFRLVKERSTASSAGRGHNTPYSSVGPWRGLSRLRRYRIGNGTFVTIRRQGGLLKAADQLEATQKRKSPRMPSVASACGNSAHPLRSTGFQGYVRIAYQPPTISDRPSGSLFLDDKANSCDGLFSSSDIQRRPSARSGHLRRHWPTSQD